VVAGRQGRQVRNACGGNNESLSWRFAVPLSPGANGLTRPVKAGRCGEGKKGGAARMRASRRYAALCAKPARIHIDATAESTRRGDGLFWKG